MTHFPIHPNPDDAVLGRTSADFGAVVQPTDAVLGNALRPITPHRNWGDRQGNQHLQTRSLQDVIQHSLFTTDPHPEIFCQLTADFTFYRQAAAQYAPRYSAHAVATEHRQVSLLWGFYNHPDRQDGRSSAPIWYNRFYFKSAALRCLLSSVQAGFVYSQLGQAVTADWDDHFAMAFGRCDIAANGYHIMAHMAQFYPEAYQAAWADWQDWHQINLAFSRQMPIPQPAIDAVIELANYYLWFQMKL
jgi:hypothetical protein